MAQSPANTPEAKKSNKTVIIAIFATALVVSGIAGGYFFMQSKKAATGAQVAAIPEPVFVPLDMFTVNLKAVEDEESVLQTEINIRVQGEEDAGLLKAAMPEVRDRMIKYLSNQTKADVVSVEGKEKLGLEIAKLVKPKFSTNKTLQHPVGVYFISLVVQ